MSIGLYRGRTIVTISVYDSHAQDLTVERSGGEWRKERRSHGLLLKNCHVFSLDGH